MKFLCSNPITNRLILDSFVNGYMPDFSLMTSTPYPILQCALRRDEDPIRNWLHAFADTRTASIFHKYDDNTNASKLTKEQKQEIKQTLEKPPSDNLIPKEFRSLPTRKEYIGGKFGVVHESDRSRRAPLIKGGMTHM